MGFVSSRLYPTFQLILQTLHLSSEMSILVHLFQPCYKAKMPKTIEKWLLFKYVSGEFTPLSRPFRSKEQAEKARQKYPERDRKTIGIGVIRTQS